MEQRYYISLASSALSPLQLKSVKHNADFIYGPPLRFKQYEVSLALTVYTSFKSNMLNS